MIIDFALIFMLLSSSAYGYIKGFSQMLISLGAFVLTIIFSLGFYSGFAENLVEKTDFGIQNRNLIASQLDAIFEEKQENAIENTPYLASLTKVTADSEGIIDFSMLSDTIAQTSSKVLVTIPAVLFVYVLLRILIYIFRRFMGGITSLPIVHGADCILGALCGMLCGILTVAASFILLIFLQFLPSLSLLREQFDSSVIVLLINDFIF